MPSTPKYDLDTDNTLGGSNASNYVSSSQKAVKDYVDAGLSGKANGSDVLKKSGNQTLDGTLTATGFTGNLNGDNYIQWGGPNLQQNVSPADAGCLDDFGHNKAAYWGGLIDAQYTVDGTTWTDYGLSDYNKWALTTANGTDVFVGKATKRALDGTLTNDNIANVRARITLHIKDANGNNRFYSALRKIVLNVSQNGASNCKVKVLTRTIENYTSGTDTWVDRGTYKVSGWSGWNSIPFINNLGGYSNQTGYNADLRLEFWSETVGASHTTSCLSIKDIRLIGVTNWLVDSFASTGHLYTMDSAKNATFPARINFGTPTEDTTTSTQGDTVGARNTKLANYALNTTFTGADGTNAGAKGLVPAPAATDNTKFLKGDGTWATPASSSDTVGTVKAFAGSTTPTGWLKCDGSAISRTTYSALFAVIGTTYGSGDGSTTFNLPNVKLQGGTISVLGNGKTLGMTDGTNNLGVCGQVYLDGKLTASAGAYNKNVGATGLISGAGVTGGMGLGVVTSGESGLTLGSTQTVNAIIKY